MSFFCPDFHLLNDSRFKRSTVCLTRLGCGRIRSIILRRSAAAMSLISCSFFHDSTRKLNSYAVTFDPSYNMRLNLSTAFFFWLTLWDSSSSSSSSAWIRFDLFGRISDCSLLVVDDDGVVVDWVSSRIWSLVVSFTVRLLVCCSIWLDVPNSFSSSSLSSSSWVSLSSISNRSDLTRDSLWFCVTSFSIA